MPEISLSTGVKFFAEMGTTILEAATRSKVQLPYSCKSGRCSTCKCKVVSGTTSPSHAENGLTDEEKKSGWVLSCVRRVETDLFIEVDDIGLQSLPTPKIYPCRINKLNRLSKDVIQVYLRLPPANQFTYIPGQYVDLIGPEGVRRSYSIANASLEEGSIELHIRLVNDGIFSKYWFNHAKINDLLRLNGPLGTFFLRDVFCRDLYFLATGTGIAPVKAILESIQSQPKESLPRSITVLWGGRTRDELYYDLSGISIKFEYIPVLSRSESDWGGATGYVQDVLLGMKPDFNNSLLYACGSNAMIMGAKTSVIGAGLPPENFYSDAFVCSGDI